MMIFRKTLCLALLLSTSTIVHAEAEGWNPATWDFEDSDIAPADGWHFGQLDNGLRYIVRRNDRPEKTAMVRMLVHAGSLDERDDERGFAHYVEHMAFNGSTHVREGEMVKLLERKGLAFGADTNASTGFDYTQYKLDLPRADEDLLDTALMLMRETASELAFDEQAVARERGVVLAERRVRNTYALQNVIDGLEFAYPDSRVARRLPIGILETLQDATAKGLRGFWQREYVPSDTVLVVIGDFDPATVEAAISERFGDWQPTKSPEQPASGPVDSSMSDRFDIYLDPALDETITLLRHSPYEDRADTKAERRRAILRNVGEQALDRRFQRLARSENPPFRSANLSLNDELEVARTSQLKVVTDDGQWRRGLDAALDEYRRVLLFGFSASEIAEQMSTLRTRYENAAMQERTRTNSAWLGSALAAAQGDIVPDGAAERLARFENVAQDITPEAVAAVLREDWPVIEAPLVRFTGKTAPDGGEAALRSAVSEGYARLLLPAVEKELVAFAYTDFGKPGQVVSDTTTDELGIRTLRFANGVMLNLKPTDLEDDRIRIELNVDGGQMLDTRENPLATELAGLLVAGGLGKHRLDELQTILAGRSVGGNIGDRPETFGANVATTPRDFALQLQLLAAFMTDPGYRAEGLGTWRQGLPAFFARLGKTPSSAYKEASNAILSDNDPRFSRQPLTSYETLGFDALQQTISNRLAKGAIEIGIVGDFDEEEAIKLVGSTFGALPQREAAFRPYDQGERKRAFTADRGVHIITHGGEADQALLRFVWPTTDDNDWTRSSELNLLARVARLMLTDKLREELGQTYSLEVDASQSGVWTDYGTFSMGAQIDVHDMDTVREAVLATVAKLRAGPVDADVIQRARQPLIETLDNRLKSNAGWMGLVDRAQGEPDDIARFTSARGRYLAISAGDLLEIAKTYLAPTDAVEFRVVPEPE